MRMVHAIILYTASCSFLVFICFLISLIALLRLLILEGDYPDAIFDCDNRDADPDERRSMLMS